MKSFKYICLISLTLFSNHLRSETLIFFSDFSPLSYQKENRISGIFVDLVSTAFKRMNIPIEKKMYPFKRSLLKANMGEGIVVGIYKTKEREEKLSYSNPFFEEHVNLFVKKGKVFEYSHIKDLANKHVAVKLGWSYGAEFDKAKRDKIFNTSIGKVEKNFDRLLNDRVDVYIDSQYSAKSDLMRLKLQNKIEMLPNNVKIGQLYIAVKKNTKNDLLERFNLEIQKMKKDGTYNKILTSKK